MNGLSGVSGRASSAQRVLSRRGMNNFRLTESDTGFQEFVGGDFVVLYCRFVGTELVLERTQNAFNLIQIPFQTLEEPKSIVLLSGNQFRNL